MLDSTKETNTEPLVIQCVAARPMRRPARPATIAATSGPRTMATSMRGSTASASHRVQFFDVDAAPLAEQHHQDRKADRRFGRSHGENEEHEHLAVDVAEEARERDEVEVDREQHQFDTHQQQDDVLAVEEDPRDADREQDAREGQHLWQRDHSRFSGSTLTMRTRSSRRTATCFLTSWTFCPVRLRIVSTIAVTIATSRITAAIWKGYT